MKSSLCKSPTMLIDIFFTIIIFAVIVFSFIVLRNDMIEEQKCDKAGGALVDGKCLDVKVIKL